MGGRHKNKPQSPSNAALVRYWRESDDDDQAWDRFYEGVYALLEAGRFGAKRMRALLDHLVEEEEEMFVADIERLATSASCPVVMGDSREPALAALSLFGVTVTGSEADIERLLSGEGFDTLVQAPRATGYCRKDCNVMFLATTLSLDDLAHASPDALYMVAKTVLECGVERRMKDIREIVTPILAQIKQKAGTKPSDDPEETLVSRVLIGAQVTFRGEAEPEVDLLDILSGSDEDAPDDADHLVKVAVNAWFDLMEPVSDESGVSISPPVIWEDIRHTLLTEHIEAVLSAALAFEGKPFVPAEIDMFLESRGSLLHISAFQNGRLVTTFDIPAQVMPDGREEFLVALKERYRLRPIGEMAASSATIH